MVMNHCQFLCRCVSCVNWRNRPWWAGKWSHMSNNLCLLSHLPDENLTDWDWCPTSVHWLVGSSVVQATNWNIEGLGWWQMTSNFHFASWILIFWAGGLGVGGGWDNCLALRLEDLAFNFHPLDNLEAIILCVLWWEMYLFSKEWVSTRFAGRLWDRKEAAASRIPTGIWKDTMVDFYIREEMSACFNFPHYILFTLFWKIPGNLYSGA